MCNRRIIAAVLALCLLTGMVGCAKAPEPTQTNAGQVDGYSSYSATSNLYTHLNPEGGSEVLEGMTLEGYELVTQTDTLALYLREESASIRVVNLQNGYVWGALRQDKPDDLNKTWSSFANSVVSIKYYDEAGSLAQIGAGHKDNKCKFKTDANGFTVDVDFRELGISLSARVELKEDHLVFSLDDSSIAETGTYTLAQVWFAPFLGSTVGDEIQGYMFVPDGSGALIRFRRPIKYLAGYNERVYGSDYSIDNTHSVGDLNANRTNDFLKGSEQITMPVYGISHGYDSNALMGYVSRGAAYAGIMADPAGIITNYNYSSAYFVYRQVYLQPTGRDGAGIQMVQRNRNLVNPELRVYFLAGQQANYIGMAKCYQSILQEEGVLPGAQHSEPALMLDFIAADVKKGFLVNTTIQLTDNQQMLDAADYLQEKGIENASFQLMGWQSGGLNGYKKTKVYSVSDLVTLYNQLQQKNCQLQLYLAPLSARQGQVSSQKDLAIGQSQEIIELPRNNKKVFLGDIQFIKTEKALEILLEQVQLLKQAGLDGFTVDELGSILYSEMLLDDQQDRNQVRQLVLQSLQRMENGLTLYRPNAYLLGVTAAYRNAPMSSSRYAFETDSVPFVQLVLSGSMVLYAPYANQSFYTEMDVLKCVEYNAYPSFLLTGSDSKELTGTPSQEYFSTCFDDWKETAVSIYQRIHGVLQNVHGQAMMNHQVLAEGIVRVDYEKGSILINYTDSAVTVDGVTVDAVDALYISK